jgi:hypothetical protein
MKSLFGIMMLFALAGAGYCQNTRILAENVRSVEKIVKSAPFSAEAVTESVQVLADGNRIIRRSTSRLFRDSDGRFRREDMPKQLGLPGAVIDMPESIMILDPVAGYKYQLAPKSNVAHQSTFRPLYDFGRSKELQVPAKPEFKTSAASVKDVTTLPKVAMPSPKPDGWAIPKNLHLMRDGKPLSDEEAQVEVERIRKERAAQIAEREKMREQAAAARRAEQEKRFQEQRERESMPRPSLSGGTSKTESLGTKNIEGIDVEGSRTTTTIPAGTIGNERAIEIVYEKWYSKDLQLIIFSRHNDPGFGEQTYRLTNINRTDPATTLFSPPPDFKVINDENKDAKPPAPPKSPSSDKKPSAPAKFVRKINTAG